jgi:hypothetical protein
MRQWGSIFSILPGTRRGRTAALSEGPTCPSVGLLDKDSPIPDLEPFGIDPILGWLHKHKYSPARIWTVTTLVIPLAIIGAALHRSSLWSPLSKASVINDIWLFLLRSRSNAGSIESMPYLRDYPSIALTATTALSVPIVYKIFDCMSKLHKNLHESGCLDCGDTEEQQRRLAEDIAELNSRLKTSSKSAFMKLLAIAIILTFVNFKLEGQLYHPLGVDRLYEKWWAGLSPFHMGGLAWITFGALGIYMVYVEAVVGFHYIRFLKKSRDNYDFRANRFNNDGFFGWSKLRQVVLYHAIGVGCSIVSAFSMFYVLQPAIGGPLTAFCIMVLIMAALWVYFSAIHILRKQIKEDREKQMDPILNELRLKINSPTAEPRADSAPAAEQIDAVAEHIKVLVAYRHLEAIEKIPSVPIYKIRVAAAFSPILAFIPLLIKALFE